jgi:hypothetical protein
MTLLPAIHKVDQTGANAGGDVIAGNKITYNHHNVPLSKIAALLEKLQNEILTNTEVKYKIEQLGRYFEKRSHDGIDGLEAKLVAGHRQSELLFALEKKEEFVKLIERWSLYLSAQEVFVFILAKIEYEFTLFVVPQLGKLDENGVNQLVHERIVEPTLDQCASGAISLNHGLVMGMIYWLAEQCFVRWHK